MDLISVIIPVYNVQEYLEKCINSVIKQTYTNLEIILVDDGSTDNSGKMCDEYAKSDDRIKVIHKENGGLSDARNVALLVMQGEYVTFVDSDDYVDKTYVDRLYKCAVTESCDMVIGSYKKVFENENDKRNRIDKTQWTIYSQKEALLDMFYRRKLPMYTHGKIYHKRIFKNIKFPCGKLFEDIPTTWSAVKQVQKIGYIDLPLYYYRQRKGSIVNCKYSHRKMDQVYAYEEIILDIKEQQDLYVAAISSYFYGLLDLYAQVDKEYADDEKYFIKNIKKYRKIVIKDRNNSKTLRGMALLSYISLKLVKNIGKIYKTRISNRI